MLGVGSVLRTVVGKSLNNLGIISGYAYAGVGFSALSFGFIWLFLLFEIVMLLIPFVLSLIEVLMGVRALRLYNEDGIIKHLNRNLWLKILFNGFLAFMISVFELSDWVLAFECLCVMIPFFGLS